MSARRTLPEETLLPHQSPETPAGAHTLSPLSKTSALALLGDGLICILEAVVAFTTAGISLVGLLPLFSFALISILTAVLLLRGLRGSQSAAIIVGLFTFSYLLIPATRSGLLQPSVSILHFALLVLIFACALVAVMTGIAAKSSGRRVAAASVPRWLPTFLGVMSGLVVGMILVASLLGNAPQSGATASTTNGIPTVHTTGARFLTNVVLVPKGKSLVITDDDGEQHIIANGSWINNTPRPQTEPGSPLAQQLDLQSGSKIIGPFNTAGIFHIYCTIHLNMNLTVIVQ